MLKLYGYWRSSASYRVRIALNLKGQAYDMCSVDLRSGEQSEPVYTDKNPSGHVPTLLTDEGYLTQSLAIIEWLDATFPEPALLSSNPLRAAHIRAAAQVIACDIHPLNNLSVLMRLRQMGHDEDTQRDWMHHWMSRGLASFAAQIAETGPFCFGDAPSLADICLVPQLYNARRWSLDLSGLGRLTEIEARCLDLSAFAAARPDVQPDAPMETKT